jgi:tyrosyl-DNA phosphodiesterase-1
MMQQNDGDPPVKRRKVEGPTYNSLDTEPLNRGLAKPISPPLSRRKSPAIQTLPEPDWDFDDVPKQTALPVQSTNHTRLSSNADEGGQETQYMASPIQLTKIRDLAPEQNVDAVSLKDILGDPLIRECWNFNYLFDLDFVMSVFPLPYSQRGKLID